jgi:hypothetical protein
MPGRDFLAVARDVVARPAEYYQRAAAVHAYYALFLECRDALTRWGRPPPRRDNVHAGVRLRFTYARDPDLHRIGNLLDELVRRRNQASYDLAASAPFLNPLVAQKAIQDASHGLALLDPIEADPARRAAAIASLPP